MNPGYNTNNEDSELITYDEKSVSITRKRLSKIAVFNPEEASDLYYKLKEDQNRGRPD